MSFSKLLIKEIAKVKGFFEIHREKRGWAISDFLYIHVSQSRRALSVLLLPFVKKKLFYDIEYKLANLSFRCLLNHLTSYFFSRSL